MLANHISGPLRRGTDLRPQRRSVVHLPYIGALLVGRRMILA